MAKVGGMKNPEPATEEVQELLNGIRNEIEEMTGSKFDNFEAKVYATQLVNGVNYFVKVHIGGDKYIHVRFHKTFQGKVSPHSVQQGKVETDELVYF